MLAGAFILTVFAFVAGLVAVLMRAAKTAGIAEATHEATMERIDDLLETAEEVKDDQKLRDETKRNTLTGIRPYSVRKYDR